MSLAGRTVLVTGSDGFIGSHVVERVLAAGGRVRAFCLYTSNGTLGWLDESPEFAEAVADGRAEVVLGDIRDPEHVAASVEGVDVVLHLAALIAIPFSYVAPRSYVETNVIGTLNVLEGVRRHGTPRMVNTSTSEVYGTPEHVPITEAHPLRGQSPYSASKIGADKMCESYALSFGTPVTTLRPFNTFGPRQSARAVIPTVLSQLLAGADEVRLGDVTPKRDFTFVTDTAEGFVRAAVADLEPGADHPARHRPDGLGRRGRRAVPHASPARARGSSPTRPGSDRRAPRSRSSCPTRAARRPSSAGAPPSPSRTASRRRPSGCGRGSTRTTAGRYHR